MTEEEKKRENIKILDPSFRWDDVYFLACDFDGRG